MFCNEEECKNVFLLGRSRMIDYDHVLALICTRIALYHNHIDTRLVVGI